MSGESHKRETRELCEVGTVGKISDYQPEGPGFNPRPDRGLNFERPSFATPSLDRHVNPIRPGLFEGDKDRGEGKCPRPIHDIEMKFGRVVENHNLV